MPSDLDQLIENPNQIVRVQEPGALDPDRLASELVDHREKTKPPAVDRLIRDGVITPNVVRPAGKCHRPSSPSRLKRPQNALQFGLAQFRTEPLTFAFYSLTVVLLKNTQETSP